jgi:hypothetical protein
MGYFSCILTSLRWNSVVKCSSFAAPSVVAPNSVGAQLLRMQLLYTPMQLIAAHLQLIAAPMRFRGKRDDAVVERGDGEWRGAEGQYLVNLSEW